MSVCWRSRAPEKPAPANRGSRRCRCVRSTSLIRPSASKLPDLGTENYVGGPGCRMHEHHIFELADTAAQHAHNRGDAAAGRYEESLVRRDLAEDEIAAGLVQLDHCSDLNFADQVVAYEAVGHRLHGDRDEAVGAVDRRSERVRTPLPHAVDVNADPYVLTGPVGLPVPPRPDHQGGGVCGFVLDRDNATPQAHVGGKRAEYVEVVLREQRCRGDLSDPDGSLAQPCQRWSFLKGGRHGAQVDLFPVDILDRVL